MTKSPADKNHPELIAQGILKTHKKSKPKMSKSQLLFGKNWAEKTLSIALACNLLIIVFALIFLKWLDWQILNSPLLFSFYLTYIFLFFALIGFLTHTIYDSIKLLIKSSLGFIPQQYQQEYSAVRSEWICTNTYLLEEAGKWLEHIITIRRRFALYILATIFLFIPKSEFVEFFFSISDVDGYLKDLSFAKLVILSAGSGLMLGAILIQGLTIRWEKIVYFIKRMVREKNAHHDD